MNKIRIIDDNIEKLSINKNIKVEYHDKKSIFEISELKILVENSSTLEIEINIKNETKLNFNIIALKDVKLNLSIFTKGDTGKIKYTYELFENSVIDVLKFQNVKSIKEFICIKLKEKNSKITYNFRTISNEKEAYDYNIMHEAKDTISNVKNSGVCIGNGAIIYQVSSFVPKNINGCIANQNNRIINLTNNKCEILPNLYIDNSNVSASHSALIGKFSDDEVFYMQSRGLDYDTTIKLLILGFLTSDIGNNKMIKEIKKEVKKYWR